MAKGKNKQEKEKGAFRPLDLLSGNLMLSSFLYKQRWYMLFLFLIIVLYISNQYNVENTIRYSKSLRKELVGLRAEYVSKSAELMRASKRSEVMRQVRERNLGLEESRIPPKRLVED